MLLSQYYTSYDSVEQKIMFVLKTFFTRYQGRLDFQTKLQWKNPNDYIGEKK